MKWLISFQYELLMMEQRWREEEERSIDSYEHDRFVDSFVISHIHPVLFVARSRERRYRYSSLHDNVAEGPMILRLVTRIYSATEIPDDILCTVDMTEFDGWEFF